MKLSIRNTACLLGVILTVGPVASLRAQRELTRIPDPFGSHESFGAHNNARLRSFVDSFGFDYEFASSTEYYEGGRFDAALDAYDQALADAPGYADALNNRAAALSSLGRLDEALAALDAALAARPDYVEAHFNRGNVLRDLMRLDEAEASFDRAIAREILGDKPIVMSAHNTRPHVIDLIAQGVAAGREAERRHLRCQVD